MKIKKTNLRQMVQEELENIIIEQEIKKVASPDQRLNEGWLQDMAAGVTAAFGKIKGAVTSIGGWEKALTDETASDKLGDEASDMMAKFVKDQVGDKGSDTPGINTWKLGSVPVGPNSMPTPLWRILKSGLDRDFQIFDPTLRTSTSTWPTQLVVDDESGLTVDLSEWFEPKFDIYRGAGLSLMLLTAQSYVVLNVMKSAFEEGKSFAVPVARGDEDEDAPGRAPYDTYAAAMNRAKKSATKVSHNVQLEAFGQDINNFKDEADQQAFQTALRAGRRIAGQWLRNHYKEEMMRKQQDPNYEWASRHHSFAQRVMDARENKYAFTRGGPDPALVIGNPKETGLRRREKWQRPTRPSYEGHKPDPTTLFRYSVGWGHQITTDLNRLWNAIEDYTGPEGGSTVRGRTSTEALELINKFLFKRLTPGGDDVLGDSFGRFDQSFTALTGLDAQGAPAQLTPALEEFGAKISDSDKKTLQLIRTEIIGSFEKVRKLVNDEWQRQENAGRIRPQDRRTSVKSPTPPTPKGLGPSRPQTPVAGFGRDLSESMGSGVSKDRLQQIIAEEVERVKAERSRRS